MIKSAGCSYMNCSASSWIEQHLGGIQSAKYTESSTSRCSPLSGNMYTIISYLKGLRSYQHLDSSSRKTYFLESNCNIVKSSAWDFIKIFILHIMYIHRSLHAYQDMMPAQCAGSHENGAKYQHLSLHKATLYLDIPGQSHALKRRA